MLAMANRIEDILTQKGWSIYKLHQEAKLTYNTTYAIVKAETIPDGTEYGSVKKIARALGVRIDDLEDEETTQSQKGASHGDRSVLQ